MTRSNARELAVHLIYGRMFTGESPEEIIQSRLEEAYYAALAPEYELYTERPNRKQVAYMKQVITGVVDRAEELDALISRYAIGWELGRISRVTRTILQLALYECQEVEDVPAGVAASEAVRLAKLYDGEEAGAFVNGILGSYLREKDLEQVADPPQDTQPPTEAMG